MNTILTILTIYGFMDFVKLPWPPVSSHIYICELFECFCETQRYTASCGDRVNTHIGTRWMNFFGGKQAGSWFDTTNLTNLLWPPLSLHRHKKKCLVSTTFILLYYTTAPNNVKWNEKRRSNPQAFTPVKTHIYTIINKSPLPLHQCRS